LGLPIVLHVVHAHEVALERLGQVRGPLRGLVHAFSGSYEIAQQYLRLGLKLSIGPGIARPGRFKQLKSALPRLGPSDWVLESDGEGPELFQAARAAAALVGRPVNEVLSQSTDGVRAVFGLT
jgi:TatD DNase family protein